MTLSAAAVLAPGFGKAQSNTREVEGGIGGTGIVGLVTELAALSVAGSRLTVDQNTTFTDAIGSVSRNELALGDSVTVEAFGASGALTARRVNLTYPLVGNVADISASRRSFNVNGATVQMQAGGISFAEGTRIAVSGLWRGNAVVATRLKKVAPGLDVIAGDVTRRIAGTQIGPLRVTGQNIGRAADGSFANALGRFDAANNRFAISSFENARFLGAAGPLKRLAIEGYLEPTGSAPGFRISGLGHSFARNIDLSAFASGKTLFSGPYTGLFEARRGVKLPENFEAQRRFLNRIAT